MRVEHVAVWTPDLDRLRAFYERWFGAVASARYVNPRTGFESYFLTLPGGGARVELMRRPDVVAGSGGTTWGYAHLAVSVGSEPAVDELSARMEAAGVPVLDGPRRTGGGYYECVVADPDGNRVEVTA